MKRLILILSLAALACVAPVWTPTQIPTPTATQAKKAIAPTPGQQNAIVTASLSLNVRVRPGEHERVTGALYSGDPVTLTGKCQAGWAEIVWARGTAWVNSRYLSDNKCKTETQ